MTTATICTGDHTSHRTSDVTMITSIGGRRYIACQHYTSGVEPCGALIDVTDEPVIRVNTCCGIDANHTG